MAKRPNKKGDPETTGHEWDGIEEFNNPLPRWWLWTFYACIVWAMWYTIAYPAWPLINEATAGYKGWSTRENVAAGDRRGRGGQRRDQRAAGLGRADRDPGHAELQPMPLGRCGRLQDMVRAVPRLGRGGASRRGVSQPAGRCTGSGAARWRRSTTPSPTASATRTTRMRAIRRCRPWRHSAERRDRPGRQLRDVAVGRAAGPQAVAAGEEVF